MRRFYVGMVIILVFVLPFIGMAQGRTIEVDSNSEIIKQSSQLSPGDVLIVKDGIYKDLKWILNVNGTAKNPIVVRAENGGEVKISGDAKVEIRGSHIVFDGFILNNGARISSEWKSHGPGLIAIYGSYNRITNCIVDNFDNVKSAYVTTSLNEKGEVPQHCRIDHCSFLNKSTVDQVINLNNRIHKRSNTPAPAMYHRIDHCLLNNPFKKKGNAGGGIRIGYYRNDYGRCLVDSNLFVRQNSEPEIITSKCQENVFYANTFIECRGTMNFRHGDRQVLLNNFFLAKNEKLGCGGVFVWGSKHLIAGNYFELGSTIKNRGNAALYINPGAENVEHALGFDMSIYNNLFVNNNGYAVHFEPLRDRREQWCAKKKYRFELPHDLRIKGNVFYQKRYFKKDFMFTSQTADELGTFEGNYFFGTDTGFESKVEGMTEYKMKLKDDKDGVTQRPDELSLVKSEEMQIEGVDLDLGKLASEGIKGAPLTESEVGPLWR
ncbi:hypothetical protein K5X82_18275 [Halosquirtibacter xylanolyticus]|uniref:chondroitinase-B domain-containing protein n=1 Tax=Halosquirtibacter xylanolyticus TaxID=3374599 RepID=UPI003748C369|nr:hypothetical protein K5X82_18275 [Prolixibacteraceae bacterium]